MQASASFVAPSDKFCLHKGEEYHPVRTCKYVAAISILSKLLRVICVLSSIDVCTVPTCYEYRLEDPLYKNPDGVLR